MESFPTDIEVTDKNTKTQGEQVKKIVKKLSLELIRPIRLTTDIFSPERAVNFCTKTQVHKKTASLSHFHEFCKSKLD